MSSTLKQAIQALKARVADAFAAIEAKGGTLPATQDSANLPAAIASIPSGGGETEVFTVQIPVLENDAICDLSGVMMQIFPAGGAPTFNGYVTYPNRINVVGIRTRVLNCLNLINKSEVKKFWFLDATVTGTTNYIRGTDVKSYDLSGLKVANSASGTWRDFLNNGSYAYTTLIGEHTLQEVLDGDVVALQGNHISITISKAVGRASILAVIKGAADLTGQTAQTLKINAADLAVLTAEDIAIATNKNWNIA
jgi:hypothetical protein